MDFQAIEQKWQKKWEEAKIFNVTHNSKKKKMYILEMFPYPSGSGLHMGHAFNYTIGDIYARFKRMQGYNVLYPMGYDAFGLPAENAAIKNKSHPKIFTEQAVKNFIKQQHALGLSYDWNRMLKTCDPEYYQWNQYFFLQFYKKGLVYRKEASVNWCPECHTVLANEQVHQGKCWRHTQTDVETKSLEQWFIKTTAYAEELLKDLATLQWPERIKNMQEHWIGKSEGTLVQFKLKDAKDSLEVYTTRIDTIFSVTFLVMAPDHPKALELIKGTTYEQPGKQFIKTYARTSEKIDESKEGFFTGKYAINPATGKELPIYLANFVLKDYGTGIVMADAHDQRDYEFAKKYDLPLIQVLKPKNGQTWTEDKAFEDYGILYNSEKFDGLTSEEAIPKIRSWLEKKGLAKKEIQYKLRDWLVSRQRYWGTPIPIIYCKTCGVVPVPEKDLPVTLPEDVTFGEGNPLANNKHFVETTCPTCKKPARRETDTMDTFMDSSWYFLRYTDNKNDKQAFDPTIANYWMPVDMYIGGAEHACMHLIYARFFTKALRDLGYLKINEPFPKLFNQGMLHKDGVVMSKSKGNVVLPEEVSKTYGIDTARLYLMSIASPDKDTEWTESGIEGSSRFIKKIINYYETFSSGTTDKKTLSMIHQTIESVTRDLEHFDYNLAIIKLRTLFETLPKDIEKKDAEIFLQLLNPFCPHLTEEFYEHLGNTKLLAEQPWPAADTKKIDLTYNLQEQFVTQVKEDLRNLIKLVKIQPKKITIFISNKKPYPFYQALATEKERDLKRLIEKYKIYGDVFKILQNYIKGNLRTTTLNQEQEQKALQEAQQQLEQEFNLKIVVLLAEQSKEQKALQATPGKPALYLE
ncbi:MAG: leucine--tRNA ligase [Nanoarchaeota archaeon]|nr:leucine--tRNA ligase [Nanoarchaeota archaeon]